MNLLNTVLVIAGGIINILGGIFHFAFWQLFNWKVELTVLDPINRNIILMLNYCLATFFLLLGIVLIVLRHEILSTLLGKAVLLVLGIVYLLRVILEFTLPESSLIAGAIIFIISSIFFLPLFLVKKDFLNQKLF